MKEILESIQCWLNEYPMNSDFYYDKLYERYTNTAGSGNGYNGYIKISVEKPLYTKDKIPELEEKYIKVEKMTREMRKRVISSKPKQESILKSLKIEQIRFGWKYTNVSGGSVDLNNIFVTLRNGRTQPKDVTAGFNINYKTLNIIGGIQ